MPNCNVDGCDERAVASIVGADGYQRAYRCRACLQVDLDLC
jgi:hypothetical protein